MNHLKAALSNGGGWLAVACVIGALLAAWVWNPVEQGGGFAWEAFSPSENTCPSSWQQTNGDDPHAGSFKACTSPDQRYIMRVSDGVRLTLDQQTGQFVDSGQFR